GRAAAGREVPAGGNALGCCLRDRRRPSLARVVVQAVLEVEPAEHDRALARVGLALALRLALRLALGLARRLAVGAVAVLAPRVALRLAARRLRLTTRLRLAPCLVLVLRLVRVAALRAVVRSSV